MKKISAKLMKQVEAKLVDNGFKPPFKLAMGPDRPEVLLNKFERVYPKIKEQNPNASFNEIFNLWINELSLKEIVDSMIMFRPEEVLSFFVQKIQSDKEFGFDFATQALLGFVLKRGAQQPELLEEIKQLFAKECKRNLDIYNELNQ